MAILTQADKELLLKDLCARLQYGVKIYNHLGQISTFYGIKDNFIFVPRCCRYGISYDDVDVESIKPYLRPMSSMTSEEWIEYCDCCSEDEKDEIISKQTGYRIIPTTHREHFFNSHHFDYRGLIEKGLALEAPADMYK